MSAFTEPRPRGNLLAIETATKTARVAVLSPAGDVLAKAAQAADRHSGHLMLLCDQVLRSSHTTPATLRAIACGAGPGSFTGLRVGLAVAKGLALPFATPLVLLSSLEVLAHDLLPAPQDDVSASCDVLVPCIDAGKGELHAQAFSRTTAGDLHAAADPWRLVPEEVAQRIAVLENDGHRVRMGGPDLAKFPALLGLLLPGSTTVSLVTSAQGPSAVALGALALRAIADGAVETPASASPVYGRLPDITQPRRKNVGPGEAP